MRTKRHQLQHLGGCGAWESHIVVTCDWCEKFGRKRPRRFKTASLATLQHDARDNWWRCLGTTMKGQDLCLKCCSEAGMPFPYWEPMQQTLFTN